MLYFIEICFNKFQNLFLLFARFLFYNSIAKQIRLYISSKCFMYYKSIKWRYKFNKTFCRKLCSTFLTSRLKLSNNLQLFLFATKNNASTLKFLFLLFVSNINKNNTSIVKSSNQLLLSIIDNINILNLELLFRTSSIIAIESVTSNSNL